MIVPRGLYSSAPSARTKSQDNPTLLVSWWCTGFAFAVIVVRLAGRYTRTEKLFREDKIIAWSIIPLLTRMALVHLILIWGTNNATTTGLTEAQIRNREMGSRLVLASRIMYAAFLWTAKLSISEFLRRLTDHVWKRSYEIGLQCVRWFLVLTFVAIVIATLAECQPFPKYWQVVPDPGPRCRQGYAQLVTMGVSDVLTDFVLVGFPVPIVLKSTIALKQKISLVMLFGLSLFLVGITLYRVVSVIDRHSEQQFRSLLASLEILAAAAVANALVLGSFVRDRGLKKQRYRFDSIAGSSSLDRSARPRATITARHWGSDADLVGDVGIRLHEGLSANEMPGPRPAPMAISRASQAKHLRPSADNEDWEGLQEQSSAEADEMEAKKRHSGMQNMSQQAKKKAPSGQLSFFDVGGLLDDDNAFSTPCNRTSTKQSQASSKRFLSRTRTGTEERIGNHNQLARTRTGTEERTRHHNQLSRTRTETEEYTAPHNRQGKNELLRTLTLGSVEPNRRNQSSNKGSSRPRSSSIRGKGIENTAPSLNDVGKLLE